MAEQQLHPSAGPCASTAESRGGSEGQINAHGSGDDPGKLVWDGSEAREQVGLIMCMQARIHRRAYAVVVCYRRLQ